MTHDPGTNPTGTSRRCSCCRGDGTAEWTAADVDESFLPHAINPPEGLHRHHPTTIPPATPHDNNPINDPVLLRRELRTGLAGRDRVRELLTAAAGTIDLDHHGS